MIYWQFFFSLQFLEQEKQRLRGQLELMEDEYEQRILELQTDIDTLKAKLNDSGDSDSRLRERSNLVAQLVNTFFSWFDFNVKFLNFRAIFFFLSEFEFFHQKIFYFSILILKFGKIRFCFRNVIFEFSRQFFFLNIWIFAPKKYFIFFLYFQTEQNQRLTLELSACSSRESELQNRIASLREQVTDKRITVQDHVTHLEILREEIDLVTHRKNELEKKVQNLLHERESLNSALDESNEKILYLERHARDQECQVLFIKPFFNTLR